MAECLLRFRPCNRAQRKQATPHGDPSHPRGALTRHVLTVSFFTAASGIHARIFTCCHRLQKHTAGQPGGDGGGARRLRLNAAAQFAVAGRRRPRQRRALGAASRQRQWGRDACAAEGLTLLTRLLGSLTAGFGKGGRWVLAHSTSCVRERCCCRLRPRVCRTRRCKACCSSKVAVGAYGGVCSLRHAQASWMLAGAEPEIIIY